MITHRFVTPEPPLPAARAYKWIAVSFVALTALVFAVIVFMLTRKTTITVVAKQDLKSVAVTIPITKNGGGNSIPGTITTSKFFYPATFHPTGTKIVSGVARGMVTIYNKTAVDQSLIKTTRLMSPAGALLRLSERIVVPANGQIITSVYADQPGATGDIAPTAFVIPGLPPEKQKVIYAQSTAAMSGGTTRVGVLSSDDITNAKTQYKTQAAEAFLNAASSTLGAGRHLVSITTGDVASNHQSGEEVSEFTLSGTSTVVIVSYNDKDLQARLEDAVGSKVDADSEKVLSRDPTPKATLGSYDVAAGTAELSVTQNAVVTLDANGDVLAPRNFMGKSRDEIERYLMGLDHVYATDVAFSPSWISTAPSVPDRIKVIVKSVK